MIEGVVNAAHEAVLTLSIEGPAGETRDIAAVIDTGFGGGTGTTVRGYCPRDPCR